jgi:hypothetical protein
MVSRAISDRVKDSGGCTNAKVSRALSAEQQSDAWHMEDDRPTSAPSASDASLCVSEFSASVLNILLEIMGFIFNTETQRTQRHREKHYKFATIKSVIICRM